MSNERDDEMFDQRVSKVYREHAAERAPDRLNTKILTMAADEVRKARGLSSLLESWTRPLAVAATVVLSLAIVLDLNRDQQVVVPASSVPESVQEQFRPKDTNVLDDARNQARLRAGSNQTGNVNLEKDPAPAVDPGLVTDSSSAASKEYGVARGCDDTARETAEDWLACIEALRKAGEVPLADQEYEQFILQFPDE
tara:strand:- start:8671 stop:9261 length:591 start_codon:yes stop_codon:yes gene_type:complete